FGPARRGGRALLVVCRLPVAGTVGLGAERGLTRPGHIVRRRLGELTGGDDLVGAHDLLDDLGGGHVAGQALLPGGQQRAVNYANALAGHADGDTTAVA